MLRLDEYISSIKLERAIRESQAKYHSRQATSQSEPIKLTVRTGEEQWEMNGERPLFAKPYETVHLEKVVLDERTGETGYKTKKN